MELSNLQTGNLIELHNTLFEVLNTNIEADPAPGKIPPFNKYFVLYLRKKKSSGLLPTHEIREYEHTKEVYLVVHTKKGPQVIKKERWKINKEEIKKK